MKNVSPEYDVVVVGGGTAGWVAAVSAARRGKKVILIERKGYPGGVLVSGLPILGFHDTTQRQVVKGLAHEFVERLTAMGGALGYHLSELWHASMVVLESAVAKTLLFEMLTEAKVEILLYAQVVDALMEGSKCRGVVVQEKAQTRLILGKTFIDTSGDALLAKFAGFPIIIEKKQQPPTLIFRLENVNLIELRNYLVQHPEDYVDWRMGSGFKVREEFIRNTQMFLIFPNLIKKVPTKGFYSPLINRFMFTVTPTGRGVVVNMLRAHSVDGLNSSSLSKATQELYSNLLPLADFFKNNIPGFSHCYVCDSEPEIQLRETSRIEGEYTLTINDILEKRTFPDTIAYGGYFIDVHHGTGSGGTWKLTEGAYGIPFRCLLPRGTENLLAAGRIISGTQEAAGSYRVMATCMALGQAAGTAVSLALDKGIPLREIEATDLRNALKSDNAVVDI